MTPQQIDELVDDYLTTSADLSLVSSRTDDPALHGELTRLVAQSSSAIYGTSARSRGGLRDVVLVQLPAALHTMRGALAVAALAFFLPALLMGIFIVNTPEALPTLGSEEDLRAFVEEDFVDYYTDNPNPVFAAAVGTNNIQVGLLAFGAGVFAGLPTLYLLAFNGLNVGVAGGIITAYGRADIFWTSILPHGLLELTAIVVSGAAGMHLGWTLLVPGDRRRSVAMAEEGQRAAVVVGALVAAFVVAGLIEGFVTPRSWHWSLEIGIGAAALGAFVLPNALLGRQASREMDARRGPAGGARVVGARSSSGAAWRRAAGHRDAG